MNTPRVKSPGLRRLTALLLSIPLAGPTFFLQTTGAVPRTTLQQQQQSERLSSDTKMYSVTAVASPQGVLIRWKTSFELDNVGFNIFRERAGLRIQINREIVPGSAFIVGQNVPLRAGYSYSWFDSGGTADSVYSIEALALNGTVKSFGNILPTWQDKIRNEGALVDSNAHSLSGSVPSVQKEYPTATGALLSSEGSREDQWVIASQTALKIAVKKDGWYRVTQQQMVAAGFDPVVDIANLRLFLNARELAIRTSRTTGQFANGDFIEFYGQGVDTPTTDSNVYYLTAGATTGKRIAGGGKRTPDVLRSEGSLPGPVSGPFPSLEFNPSTWFWWIPSPNPSAPGLNAPAARKPVEALSSSAATALPVQAPAETASIEVERIPKSTPAADTLPVKATPSETKPPAVQEEVPAAAKVTKKKSRKGKKKRVVKRRFAHAVAVPVAGGNALSFSYTVERKDRQVYFSSLINGDTENYFGAVLTTLPVDQALTIPNPATLSGGIAQLQIALQGASSTNHVVNVEFNGVAVGTLSFFGQENKVMAFNVPAAQLQNGANNVRLIPAAGSGLSIVDYVRVTYPHLYIADSGTLRFTLDASQSARIDGFNTQNIRLIDYTDPFAVKVIRPLVEANGAGYTAQVPSTTSQRLFYAIPESDADQSATLSLNQPSNLNAGSNGADLLIIAHRSLIPSLAPLTALRTSQGLIVKEVDVEDTYDEFSFGAHGPQPIRDFLSWANTHWTKVPRYIIFAGDASSDPRNYLGFGNLDFVPTKLVDATFSETASDDWLCDFNNDGAADIPVGRLPVRTPAEASLVISKIVNFAPANTPQTALLVADTQGSYYFNFEQANTQVQTLLPASMTVQRVDRRLEPSDAQARADILAKFNAGLALVNYSGHGNVDTWTGGSIFTTADAATLTNGNRLPFVVVMDCLNGYFQDPQVQGIAEALIKAPNGGAVAAFASSGSTIPDGQHAMSTQLYTTLYGSQSVALGDAIKTAKAATFDIDVRRTWVFFGDPSMKIR